MNQAKKPRLLECVRPVGTWNPNRSADCEEFNYIDIGAIDQTHKTVVGMRAIRCGDAPSRARQLVAAGDILVSTVRPNLNAVAKLGVEHDGATASTGFCIIRPDPAKLDGAYAFQWVKSPGFVNEMVNLATGASYPAVSDKIVLGSCIPLPPLTEQRRISAILDQADTLRAQRRQALSEMEGLVQAVFVEMFGDADSNPHNWPLRSLGSLILIGPQNGLYKPSSDYGVGTPILRIDAFYDGVVTKLATLKRLRVTDKELELYGLKTGDLVINRVNSLDYLGKSALIPELAEATVFESNMMRFSVNLAEIDPTYLIQFLQLGFIKRQILSRAKNAVNQSSINQQDVKALNVLLPPLHLQQAFASRIRAIESLKARHRAALTDSDALFSSLQHSAFNGAL